MFESLYIVKNVKYHQEMENESVKIPDFKAGTSGSFPQPRFILRTINLFALVRFKEI